MSRYQKRFLEVRKRNEIAFVPFVVLGDPDYAASKEIIRVLVGSGADVLELGLPFSDPIADGKTIQAADQRSISSGMNTLKAFELIKFARSLDRDIPIGLLVYFNLVFSLGIEEFYRMAKAAGVDGILIADMPIEESGQVLGVAEKQGIDQIFLIAPTTDNKRAKAILSKSRGFAYLVSLTGITGERKKLSPEALSLVRRVKKFSKLPLCLGFGISNSEHVRMVKASKADGVIVGSAIVKLVEKNSLDRQRMLSEIRRFAGELKNATRKSA